MLVSLSLGLECSYSTSCAGGQPVAATSYVLLGCQMHE